MSLESELRVKNIASVNTFFQFLRSLIIKNDQEMWTAETEDSKNRFDSYMNYLKNDWCFIEDYFVYTMGDNDIDYELYSSIVRRDFITIYYDNIPHKVYNFKRLKDKVLELKTYLDGLEKDVVNYRKKIDDLDKFDPNYLINLNDIQSKIDSLVNITIPNIQSQINQSIVSYKAGDYVFIEQTLNKIDMNVDGSEKTKRNQSINIYRANRDTDSEIFFQFLTQTSDNDYYRYIDTTKQTNLEESNDYVRKIMGYPPYNKKIPAIDTIRIINRDNQFLTTLPLSATTQSALSNLFNFLLKQKVDDNGDLVFDGTNPVYEYVPNNDDLYYSKVLSKCLAQLLEKNKELTDEYREIAEGENSFLNINSITQKRFPNTYNMIYGKKFMLRPKEEIDKFKLDPTLLFKEKTDKNGNKYYDLINEDTLSYILYKIRIFDGIVGSDSYKRFDEDIFYKENIKNYIIDIYNKELDVYTNLDNMIPRDYIDSGIDPYPFDPFFFVECLKVVINSLFGKPVATNNGRITTIDESFSRFFSSNIRQAFVRYDETGWETNKGLRIYQDIENPDNDRYVRFVCEYQFINGDWIPVSFIDNIEMNEFLFGNEINSGIIDLFMFTLHFDSLTNKSKIKDYFTEKFSDYYYHMVPVDEFGNIIDYSNMLEEFNLERMLAYQISRILLGTYSMSDELLGGFINRDPAVFDNTIWTWNDTSYNDSPIMALRSNRFLDIKSFDQIVTDIVSVRVDPIKTEMNRIDNKIKTWNIVADKYNKFVDGTTDIPLTSEEMDIYQNQKPTADEISYFGNPDNIMYWNMNIDESYMVDQLNYRLLIELGGSIIEKDDERGYYKSYYQKQITDIVDLYENPDDWVDKIWFNSYPDFSKSLIKPYINLGTYSLMQIINILNVDNLSNLKISATKTSIVNDKIIDQIIKEYVTDDNYMDYEFLHYLKLRLSFDTNATSSVISPDKIRETPHFGIIQHDTRLLDRASGEYNDFFKIYNQVRNYIVEVKYVTNFEGRWQHYSNFMLMLLVYGVFNKFMVYKLEKYSKRSYDNNDIYRILDSFNLSQLKDLNIEILRRLIEDISFFVSHNSTNIILSRLIDLIGGDRTKIKKFDLIKTYNYKLNDSGEIPFEYPDDIESMSDIVKPNFISREIINIGETSNRTSNIKTISDYYDFVNDDEYWAWNSLNFDGTYQDQEIEKIKNMFLSSPYNKIATKYIGVESTSDTIERNKIIYHKIMLMLQYAIYKGYGFNPNSLYDGIYKPWTLIGEYDAGSEFGFLLNRKANEMQLLNLLWINEMISNINYCIDTKNFDQYFVPNGGSNSIENRLIYRKPMIKFITKDIVTILKEISAIPIKYSMSSYYGDEYIEESTVGEILRRIPKKDTPNYVKYQYYEDKLARGETLTDTELGEYLPIVTIFSDYVYTFSPITNENCNVNYLFKKTNDPSINSSYLGDFAIPEKMEINDGYYNDAKSKLEDDTLALEIHSVFEYVFKRYEYISDRAYESHNIKERKAWMAVLEYFSLNKLDCRMDLGYNGDISNPGYGTTSLDALNMNQNFTFIDDNRNTLDPFLAYILRYKNYISSGLSNPGKIEDYIGFDGEFDSRYTEISNMNQDLLGELSRYLSTVIQESEDFLVIESSVNEEVENLELLIKTFVSVYAQLRNSTEITDITDKPNNTIRLVDKISNDFEYELSKRDFVAMTHRIIDIADNIDFGENWTNDSVKEKLDELWNDYLGIETIVKYDINISYGDGGIVEPSVMDSVKAGSNVEFVIVPNDGYELLNVEINGVIDTTCKGFTDYIIYDVQEDKTVKFTFQKIIYEIVYKFGTTGTMNEPSSVALLNYTDSLKLNRSNTKGQCIKYINNTTDRFYEFEDTTSSTSGTNIICPISFKPQGIAISPNGRWIIRISNQANQLCFCDRLGIYSESNKYTVLGGGAFEDGAVDNDGICYLGGSTGQIWIGDFKSPTTPWRPTPSGINKAFMINLSDDGKYLLCANQSYSANGFSIFYTEDSTYELEPTAPGLSFFKLSSDNKWSYVHNTNVGSSAGLWVRKCTTYPNGKLRPCDPNAPYAEIINTQPRLFSPSGAPTFFMDANNRLYYKLNDGGQPLCFIDLSALDYENHTSQDILNARRLVLGSDGTAGTTPWVKLSAKTVDKTSTKEVIHVKGWSSNSNKAGLYYVEIDKIQIN
jgi:hypothetical protein